MDPVFLDNFTYDLRRIVTKLLEPPMHSVELKVEDVRVGKSSKEEDSSSSTNESTLRPKAGSSRPTGFGRSAPHWVSELRTFDSMERRVEELEHELPVLDAIKLVTMSDCEIGLDILVANSHAAENIQTIHLDPARVQSYTIDALGRECALVAKLMHILPRLTRLHTFEWLGFEKPEEELWDRLLRCCPQLHTIRTSIGARDLTAESKMFRLRGLRHLSFYSTCPMHIRAFPVELPWSFFAWLISLASSLISLTLRMSDHDCRPLDATKLARCRLPRVRRLDLHVDDEVLAYEFGSRSLQSIMSNASESEWQSWEFFKQDRKHQLLAWLLQPETVDQVHVDGSWDWRDFPSDSSCAPLTSFSGSFLDARMLYQNGCTFTSLHLRDQFPTFLKSKNGQWSYMKQIVAKVEELTLEFGLTEADDDSFLEKGVPKGTIYAHILGSFLEVAPALRRLRFLCHSTAQHKFKLCDLFISLPIQPTLEMLEISKYSISDGGSPKSQPEQSMPKFTPPEEGPLDPARVWAQRSSAIQRFTFRFHTELDLHSTSLSLSTIVQEQTYSVRRSPVTREVGALLTRSLVKNSFDERSNVIREVENYEVIPLALQMPGKDKMATTQRAPDSNGKTMTEEKARPQTQSGGRSRLTKNISSWMKKVTLRFRRSTHCWTACMS